MRQYTSILISFFIILLLSISACGTLIDNKQDSAEVKNRETQDKLDDKMEYPIYEVEDIDNLHLGNEEFNIVNYFIRYESEDENLYYIDSNNILWGYGNNQYGQLGNGKKHIQQGQYDDSFEMTPQKIAENVIHVDFGGFLSFS